MKKILFVDDEQKILDGLRRMLRPNRDEWEMTFLIDPQTALKSMEQNHYDVVVTDIRMPGMSGVALLEQVRRIHPTTIRIALSGQTNLKTSLQATESAHQFLTKPTSPEVLRNALKRACSLNEFLSNNNLQSIITRLKHIPSQPALYLQISDLLQSSNYSTQAVGEIIRRDPAMSAKLLQLVNSAFFGVSEPVNDPAYATCLLGADTIRSLVLSIHIFSSFSSDKIRQLGLSNLWSHSLTTAAFSRHLATKLGLSKSHIDKAFVAGLLHDIGQLILADNVFEDYTTVLDLERSQNLQRHVAEDRVLHTDHGAVGAYLLGMWGLSTDIVTAIAFHHNPAQAQENDSAILKIIHLANVFEHRQHLNGQVQQMPNLDRDYFMRESLPMDTDELYVSCRKLLNGEKAL